MFNTTKFLMFIALVTCAVLAQANPNSQLQLPSLPEAVSNNAVAAVEKAGRTEIFSFMGLSKGKSVTDIHNKAWKLTVDNSGNVGDWQEIRSVPSAGKNKGRLASIAVAVDDVIYLFGGYTVAANHTENSTAEVFAYHVESDIYHKLEPMPVPVDDTVALTYRNRYIYLISGWHNDGNINLVQVFDTLKNEWFQASPFVGAPVFGHAAGIVDNTIMVCDGVKVQPHMLQRRTFVSQNQCFLGEIDVINPAKINWYQWVHPTDEGRYRMAAAGDAEKGEIVFAGGSSNPYNYNGIGYNKKPSQPSSEMWIYNIEKRSWSVKDGLKATMDHRGLININNNWFTIGGMLKDQQVTEKLVNWSQ